MKPLLRLFLLLLVVALAACQGPGAKGPDQNGPGDEDPQPLAGVITGALTDSTGAVVAGAQVTLGSTAITVAALEPAAAQLVVTNEYGQFAFDVDNEGEYTLTTMLDNEGAFTRVTVVRDADGNLTSNPITMQSAEFGAVAGTVAGNNDGAWAFLLGTSFLAATHDDGEFIISRVPAGTYQLAPGLLGVRGKAVTVLVESGKVTTIDTPLAFGPIITGVEPGEFMAAADAWGDGDEEAIQIVLRGSGFGKSMGVAQLWYAGVPVNEHITSWSDEEIVLRMWWDNSYRTANNEDLRFTFYDVTGEAVSGRFGVMAANLVPYTCSDNWPSGESWVSVRVESFGLAVEDAPVVVTVENGVARAALGAPASSQFRTNDRGCVNVYVEPDLRSRLPVHVNVSVEGVNLGHLVLSESANLTLDNDMFVYADADDTVSVSGQVLYAYTGQGVNDDGQFRLQIRDPYYGAILYDDQLAIDSSGRFSAPIGTNSEPYGYYDLTVFHRDVEIQRTWVWIYPLSRLGMTLVLDGEGYGYPTWDGSVFVTGSLLYSHNGTGVFDDGEFMVRIEQSSDGSYLPDMSLTLDSDGGFAISFTPALASEFAYNLTILHKGQAVASDYFWVHYDTQLNAIIELDSGRFRLTDGSDTVNLTGRILDTDTQEAVLDDGRFTAQIGRYYDGTILWEGALDLDTAGRFSLPISSESAEPGSHRLSVFHMGAWITSVSFDLEPGPTVTVQAITDSSNPVYSVELAPNASITLAVDVNADVAAAGSALYLEATGDLHVDWDGSRYHGSSYDFWLVTEAPWDRYGVSPLSSGISPMAIGTAVQCRFSCVIVHSMQATAYVTITNTHSVIRNATLYAYTEPFRDLGEPGNDTRAGAVPIAMPGIESGALETIGDVDYYEVVGDDGQVGTVTFNPGNLAVLYLETASGEHKAGPYGYGSPSIQVEAGDYIRIEASSAVAAASAHSLYWLEIGME